MPFNPFTALTSKIFGGAAIALALVCGILWWQKGNAERAYENALRENGAIKTKLETSNASIAELTKWIEGQNEAISLMQREADSRVAASRDALAKAKQEGKPAMEIAERLRNAPSGGDQCRTSDTIMQNRDKL